MDAIIIGMGRMGMKHAETLTAAGHRILATANNEKEARRAMDCRADIAVIASPDHCHAAQAAFALFNGMHVFCEKPLAVGKAQLEDLLDVHAASNRKLTCHFPLRHIQEFRKVRMQRHELGNVYGIMSAYQWGRLSNLKNGWRGANPHYSIVMGGLIHTIDIIQWVMDEEIDVRSAVGGNAVYAEFPNPLFVQATFKIGEAVGSALADFSFEGEHRHWLQIAGDKDTFDVKWRGESPKEPAMQEFLACLVHDRDTGIDGMVSAHRAALEIDRMARAA